MQAFKLGEIVASMGGTLEGDPALLITHLAPLARAGQGALTFATDARAATDLVAAQATCVIVSSRHAQLAKTRGATLVVTDPYLYFARLTQWWAKRARGPLVPSIHASAVIHNSAVISQGVNIGALAVIEAGVVLEADVQVGAQCFIGEGAFLGQGTQLAARVVIGAKSSLGSNCLVHSGAVIGADGFGFASRHTECQAGWEKIEQLGAVEIGDDVEIGANTCIDRGALDNTVIGRGVKLDNLIQIGHNVRIGDHTALAGCVGVAGSAIIGAHCTIGGAANILGHLTLADKVHIAAASTVTRSLLVPGHYCGIFPIDEKEAWEKNAASLKQLYAYRNRLRMLEKKLL